MVKKICVLGAGIIGLYSAVRILEDLQNVDVTVIAEKFSPNNTTDVAAGFWRPYKMGSTNVSLIKRWGDETYKYLLDLHESPMASKLGINLVSGYWLDSSESNPAWKDTVYNLRDLTPEENKLFPNCTNNKFFTSIIVTGTIYMEWLMSRATGNFPAETSSGGDNWTIPHISGSGSETFQFESFVSLGGKIKSKKIESLSEVMPDFDVVINCCGLGNYQLINDHQMTPIRGQVIRANAPWIKHFYFSDADVSKPIYIFPTMNYVVMGGTAQMGNWDSTPNEHDQRHILEGCARIVPSLKNVEIIDTKVGLRPFRKQTRLDQEIVTFNGRPVLVINNYGHGGCGLTTFVGCAKDVVSMIREAGSVSRISCKL